MQMIYFLVETKINFVNRLEEVYRSRKERKQCRMEIDSHRETPEYSVNAGGSAWLEVVPDDQLGGGSYSLNVSPRSLRWKYPVTVKLIKPFSKKPAYACLLC